MAQLNSATEVHGLIGKKSRAVSTLLQVAKILPASQVFSCLQYLSLKIEQVLENSDSEPVNISPDFTYQLDLKHVLETLESMDFRMNAPK